jgi:hypothetical protein
MTVLTTRVATPRIGSSPQASSRWATAAGSADRAGWGYHTSRIGASGALPANVAMPRPDAGEVSSSMGG